MFVYGVPVVINVVGMVQYYNLYKIITQKAYRYVYKLTHT